MDLHDFLRRIPKVELHVHLEGSVKASTFVELARKHGVKLPPHDKPEDLYDYPDIYRFLQIYDLVARAVRDRDDFRRITYETLQEAAEHNVRYREMFWSPKVHMDLGVPYDTAIDGIRDGIRDAERDYGIRCKMIAGINRMEPPEKGFEMVKTVIENPRDELIGIGMDYAEADNPPEKFWKAYRLAAQHGLHLTAHASEDAPPRNVETCLDLLGCERIDHGYHVIEDEALTRRCAEEGVVFTVCPISTAWVYFGNNLANHPIKEMARRGLKIMVNCDDPPMFKTNPTKEYIVMAEYMGFSPADFREFVLNGIDGSWLDDPTKRRWRREWAWEIDKLMAQLEKEAG
ncbi:adenosine deaminase [Candidatus Hecatella orcuttiae]|jgi:adenosine deaminase|uniref:adenosine deaminase n=1 Tax=Candidatus Hecatella orcuttiae TaxID=1935119 RepID=UPI00286803CC|nr:adenosine deaminase [Candidatus Hecatella orcuttiae]